MYQSRTICLWQRRRNAGIDPQDQIQLAAAIRKNARAWHSWLSWEGYPQWEPLKFTCNLIYEYLVKRRRDGISSGAQLAFRLNKLRTSANIRTFIREVLQRDTRANGDPDVAVRLALEFQRKWAMFRFPRMLLALDLIQQEVFDRLRMPVGRYGKFAADVENTFLPAELVGLDEYGLPVQLGMKLRSQLRLGEGLDLAIESLRKLELTDIPLSKFERLLIEQVKSGL